MRQTLSERKATEVIYGRHKALTCRWQQPIVPDVLRHAVEDRERTGQSNPGDAGVRGVHVLPGICGGILIHGKGNCFI